jgi:hypothetical protein
MRFIDKKEINDFIVEGSYCYWGKYPQGISRLICKANEDVLNQFIYEG